MSSASSSRITTSIDYESVDEIIGVEDLEECDISTELPVFRTSTSKSSSITLVSSPQSVSFDESSIICPVPLEKATLEAYQEVNHPIASTSNLNTGRTKSNRSRSTTTSSWSSSDSTEFTSITPLSETNFPSSIPRIAYSDWQKFGIELYKPKPQKIKTKEMYYEYHSIKIKSSTDLDRPKNERSNSQPTPKSKSKHQNQSNSHQSKSIFNSNQESNKPILLLRRATLEGYYCPDL